MDFRDERSVPPLGGSAVIKELAQGLDSVKKLASLLQFSSPEDHPLGLSTASLLVEEIKRSVSKAMAELKAGNLMAANLADSSSCVTSNKQSTEGARKIQNKRTAVYRRRGSPYSSTKMVSTTIDDGHSWRKYGQKVIYSATHPRSYFRCTHKLDQGCKASKQVQRSEEDPSLFITTYFGEHTCIGAATKVMPSVISFESKYGGNMEKEALLSVQTLLKQETSEEEVVSSVSYAASPSDYFVSAEMELKDSGKEGMEASFGEECGELSSGLAYDFNSVIDFGELESLFSYDHTELFED